ncbi:RecF/RecN/SMC, N-terminal [Kalmanozyma brasiliensis GHG001]|uniref:RecF/RecN/SMC N-terminal domain-containing protein n=2 Tax=Kalmanozyma brasiliensis TaxID=1392244 RepID=V5E8N0_KALBG|nr:RecF/RecN/SMC, N-terminal [Kalmanozyma brasiliensis GHG001]EST06671.1 RecF/RecN/SMC, N-terminal [Kalmanozyma brasiliensis GHG001]DBA11459.1 TPA_inf: SMC6 [Kalmanozyma brasiliensis]
MSQRKRPSQATDGGGFTSDEDAIDAISPKRMRLNRTSILSNRDDVPEQSQSRSPDARSARRSQATAPPEEDDGIVTPDEREEDHEEEEASEEEGTDEEEEDEIDSQAEEDARRAEAGQGTAQSGIVDKIELRNFMCHANFTIEFGPKLNFVMGRNGSGKSTILTALMIALGGKTSSTNRGSSLKDLVKKGETSATITVTVHNGGSDAFKPEAYGHSIIIERRILAEGGGTWKMKSANGRVVATTKSELESFCDFANIQPDNPIHILTQDTARQFLGSSDPSEIYKFFLEGTQLSQLVREYNLIETHVRSMKSALALKSGALEQLETLAEHALQQWKKVRETRGYQEKIDALNREFVWVQVNDAENELQQAVEKTERIRAKLVKCDASLNKTLEALKKCEERIVELEKENTNFDEVFSPIQEQHEELVRKDKDLAQQIKAFTRQEREINDKIIDVNRDIERYEDQIREETAKLAQDGQTHRQQLDEERQSAQRQRQELQDETLEKEEQQRELETQIAEATQREEDEGQNLRRLKDEYSTKSSQLVQLRESSRNRLTAYGGAKVPALLQAINSDNGWRSKPIGPLGTHVKLKDMRWQRILETVMGNTLNAYFVSNHADRVRLKKIMDRVGIHQPIVIGTDALFDYSSGEPNRDITTILRVLDCDDEIVKRQLIMSVHIERAALVDRRADGDRLMRTQPYNVQACFSADMFSISSGATGSLSTALQDHRGPPRLSQNVGDAIRKFEHEVQQLDHEIAECTQRLRDAKQERVRLERAKDTGKRDLNNLRRRKDDLRQQISRIDEQMQEAAPGNISALEDAKLEVETNKEVILQQFQDIQRQKTAIVERQKPSQEEMKALEERRRQFEERMGGIHTYLVAAVAERVEQINNRDHWQRKRASIEADVKESEAEETRLEADHQHLESEALKYCDRVDTTRTPKQIQREINELELLMKKAAREAGITLDQAASELQKRKDALTEAQEEVHNMNEAERRLRSSLAVRYAKWNFFRRSIALRAKSNFARNLATRGYEGTLKFNHKLEKLSLAVDTQAQDQSARATQTQTQGKAQQHSNKGMSGGERSFATACLLLSLWQAMSSPIRCLDEFDIFMDQVNRRVALSMIVNEARATPHVQYIMITPQDMPDMKGELDDVRMLVVNPPERNEGALAGN